MNLQLFYKVEIMCVHVLQFLKYEASKKMAHELSLLFLECFQNHFKV